MVARGAVGYTSVRSAASRRDLGRSRVCFTVTEKVEVEDYQMESSLGLFDVLISIVAAPFLLLQFIIFSALDLLAFDVLNLGPFLPIEF